MSVKIFCVQGNYQKRKRTYHFKREIRALSEDEACDYLYSLLGSFHRVGRKAITIEKINEISLKEAKAPIIQQLAEI